MVADNQIWPPDDGQQLLKRCNAFTVLITQNNNSHMPSLTLWSSNFGVDGIRYRPLPYVYPDIFESATSSFQIQKFSRPHTYQSSNRIYPSTHIRHVYGFILVPSGNIGNRACVVKHAKFASCSAFHGEELGLILLRHRIKKISGVGDHTIPD